MAVLALTLLALGAAAQTSRVFVTSTTHLGGALGGLTGADAICQRLGAAVDPGAIWVAWLSTSKVDAKDRLGPQRGPFVRAVDGMIIANDMQALLNTANTPFTNAVSNDQDGKAVEQHVGWTGLAWTGTSPSGEASLATCTDWNSSSNVTGQVGRPNLGIDAWTDSGIGGCTALAAHLYCFEFAPTGGELGEETRAPQRPD